MKTKVNGGEALLVMLAVTTTTIILTIILLQPYFLSNYSAEATSSGRADDGQSSEDLGKEEQDGRDDGQSSEDLGKEEQDEASPQAAGQNAPDREESDGVIEGNPNQELLNQLRGGEDIKGSGTAEGEAEGSGGGGDDNISPEDLRGSEADENLKMAPVAISGNNAYVVWWTNDTTGNNEVIFRASTDGGQTFGDKINLSNTTNANSTRAEIDSGANSVVVTWWETNQTDDTPVMRLSSDNGATFGPLLQLGTNATIGQSE